MYNFVAPVEMYFTHPWPLSRGECCYKEIPLAKGVGDVPLVVRFYEMLTNYSDVTSPCPLHKGDYKLILPFL